MYDVTDDAKRKILGLNSARLYGMKDLDQSRFKPVPQDYRDMMPDELKGIMEMPGYRADNMSKLKERHAAAGAEPNNKRYGWVRKQA